jgi:hypothetical protein
MGVYTPSNNELSDLVIYLQSQRAKGLPPSISAILDNLEKSAPWTGCPPSYERPSGSHAYNTPSATPQPESPVKGSSHNFRNLPGEPDPGHHTINSNVSFFFFGTLTMPVGLNYITSG